MAFNLFRRPPSPGTQPSASGQDGGGDDSDFVRASVVRVGDLFSDNFGFRLPWFQRAYAWQEEHVGRLISDIFHAMSSPPHRYFLGQIRIAGTQDQGYVHLIDGQQRLVTLTILFSVLRDLAEDQATRDRADGAVKMGEGGNIAGGRQYRIAPQPVLEAFFSDFVQAPGGSLQDFSGDVMELPESERFVLLNRNHLSQQLTELLPTSELRSKFLSFVLQQCWVLVVDVDDVEEAWSMLSVEEETGLAFHSSERSKLSLISVMKREEQEDAGKVWEQCQSFVEADDLCRLLTHVRAIALRRRSSKPVEKDLAQSFRLDENGLQFLKEELLVRAGQFAAIKNMQIGDEMTRAQIAPRIKALLWLENQHWVPAVMHWLTRHGDSGEATVRFFLLIERLAWFLRLSGSDSTEQERRFIAVIKDIDQSADPDQMKSLEIEEKRHRAVLKHLRSRTFYAKHYCGLVLRLLNFRLGMDPGIVDRKTLTVEHVLPRNPAKQGQWREAFPTGQAVSEYANRLGNLVLLTRVDNQRAGANDFDFKRPILADSSLPLAAHLAAHHEQWTAELILARTEDLIGILFSEWEVPM